jgi:hypothetical protein
LLELTFLFRFLETPKDLGEPEGGQEEKEGRREGGDRGDGGARAGGELEAAPHQLATKYFFSGKI